MVWCGHRSLRDNKNALGFYRKQYLVSTDHAVSTKNTLGLYKKQYLVSTNHAVSTKRTRASTNCHNVCQRETPANTSNAGFYKMHDLVSTVPLKLARSPPAFYTSKTLVSRDFSIFPIANCASTN